MRIRFYLFLKVFLISVISMAQEKTVTGVVTDQDGLPLPGASVIVKGTNSGTQTDFDGNYSINVANGSTLVFSYVGLKTTERAVGASSTINVTLELDSQSLEEVVVVGYGGQKKAGTVVGSVVQVTAEQLAEKPSPNVLDAMQGKVPGLQVFSSSGEPSSTPSIRLHGVGSLAGSSTPLFVIDGIPVSDQSLISLNSKDFESVTVLKDASATSIYGSRAANGVIVITTKKGRRGEQSRINVSTQYGFSKLANTDYFESMMNTKELTDLWVETGFQTRDQVDALLDAYPNDTQWYKYYYKDYAPTTQTDVAVSGGSDKTSYYVSGGIFKQQGLAYRSDFDRYTFRSNIDSKVNDWFRFGVNLSMGYDERQTNPYGSNSTNRGLSLLAQPFYSPYDENGNDYEGVIPGWGRYSPKYLADKNPFELNNVQFNPTAYVEVTPFKNLVWRTQAGMDFYDQRESSKRLPSFVGELGNGRVSETFRRGITQTITNTLEYQFNLGELNNFTVLAGQEYVNNDYERFSAESTGQNDDRLVLLTAGPNNRDVGHYKSEYVFKSYFGRLEYNYDNKYFLDGAFRRDGSSRFGSDNRYANFWSAGAMWKAKREAFLQDVDWLDYLDVRASIGTSGNSDIGNYQSLALVGTNQYGGETGWSVSTPGNPALGWEEQTKFSTGVKFGLFDRVRLDVEYYNRETSSMLIAVPYPYTSGFGEVTTNVGTLQNSGFDVTLDFDIAKGQDFYVTPYLNFNYNQNKITELFQGRDYWIIPNTGVSWVVDQPVSYFYPVFAGVNSQTGAPEWYVPNANPDEIVNPNFDPNNVTSDFNEAALQQNTDIERYPPFNGGFGLNAGYKGLTLQADFVFSNGKYLINNDRYFFENPNVFTGFNQSKRVQDYWRQPGDESLFPSYSYQFTQFDSRLIEDASFIRLKSLSLAYNVPSNIVEKTMFVKGLRVYVVGRNLLTWTDFLGPDPEIDSNLTLGANPNTKQFTFGVDITL